ncbi:MAG: response regulator, partial [Elusimicrobiaceae bacterium]|nr:response regulator [Elusimicrobiaceae bacterium]
IIIAGLTVSLLPSCARGQEFFDGKKAKAVYRVVTGKPIVNGVKGVSGLNDITPVVNQFRGKTPNMVLPSNVAKEIDLRNAGQLSPIAGPKTLTDEKKSDIHKRIEENIEKNKRASAERAAAREARLKEEGAQRAVQQKMEAEQASAPSAASDIPSTSKPGPAPEKSFMQDPSENQSVTAEFHRRTKENMPDPEISGDPYRRAKDLVEKPTPVKSNGRSFESLVTEAQKDGILPQNWQNMSREELENFIRDIRQMQEKTENELFEAYRRKYFAQEDRAGENMVRGNYNYQIEVWARQQPDYFEDNYLEWNCAYNEPFNESVTSLRILVVNDSERFLSAYLNPEDPRVTVEGSYSIAGAIEKLEANPKAYDIIFTDYHLRDGKSEKLSSYVYTNKLNIPVISLANAEALPSTWYYKHMQGSLHHTAAQVVYNYASNIVATGRAFPNGK